MIDTGALGYALLQFGPLLGLGIAMALSPLYWPKEDRKPKKRRK